MNKMVKYATLVLGLLLAGPAFGQTAGSGSSGGPGSAPVLSPLPTHASSGAINAWTGTRIDLAVADAWAACAVPASGVDAANWPSVDLTSGNDLSVDEYLAQVATDMLGALCTDVSTSSPLKDITSDQLLKYWFVQRSVAVSADGVWHNDCNTDGTVNPLTAAPNVALPSLVATPVPADMANQSGYGNLEAAQILNEGSINVCIAKHLRSQSPGTIGGEALLYTADEQRQLQQVIVERTRIAMLAYAALGMVFNTQTPPGETASALFATMQTWANDSNNYSAMKEMAEDFAYAVDLNVQASQEMLTLLGRSASARLPRGGNPVDPQDEAWGYSSWRERALASLYGGNPLAQNADLSAPWTNTLSQADTCPGCPGIGGYDFPSNVQPYVDVSIEDPHVQEFDRLVRAYNAMDIKQTSTTTGGMGFSTTTQYGTDGAGSALWMYMTVEAGLRTANCDTFIPSMVPGNIGSCKTYALSDVPPLDGNNPSSYQSFDLFKLHGITPDHASLYAKRLAEYVYPYYTFNGNPRDGTPTGQVGAAVNVNGTMSVVTHADESGSNTSQSWFHFPSTTTFTDRKAEQFSGVYTDLAPWHVPSHIDVTADWPSDQGLMFDSEEMERARRMGAISSLAAVRTMLFNAYVLNGSQPPGGLLSERPKVLGIIDGAIGRSSFGVDAITEAVPLKYTEFGVPLSASTAQLVFEVQPSDGSGDYAWRTMLTTDANDSWWDTKNPGKYTLYAVPSSVFAANALLFPRSQSFGAQMNVTSLMSQAIPAQLAAGPQNQSDATGTYFWQFYFGPPGGQLLPGNGNAWTFFVVKNSGSGSPLQYALLEDDVILQVLSSYQFQNPFGFVVAPGWDRPVSGHWTGFGGTLTSSIHQIMARDAFNPALPEFDGFGIPLRWSPPTDPALFAGSQGQSPVQYYLSQAQTAAQSATTQVNTAIQTLLQSEEDQAALTAAIRKSSQVSQLQQQSLCGPANTNCDTTIVDVPFSAALIWDQYAFSVNPSRPSSHDVATTCAGINTPIAPANMKAADVETRLDCQAANLLSIIPSTFRLAEPVSQHLNDAQVPSFSDYSGGSFQKVLIEQWTAYNTLKTDIQSLMAAEAAAYASTEQFGMKVETDTTHYTDDKQNLCSPEALAIMVTETSCGTPVNPGVAVTDALAAAFPPLGAVACVFGGCGNPTTPQCNTYQFAQPNQSDSDLTWDDATSTSSSTSAGTSTGAGIGFIGSLSFGDSQSASSSSTPVSLFQKRQFCEQVEATMDQDEAQAISAMFEAFASLAGRATTLVQDSAAVQQASADGAIALEQVSLASATAALEAEQTAATQTSSLPLYRQVHNFDAWEAQALLDAARVAAVTARRAIENHYVVDMSTLTSPEAFVDTPKAWADSVYQYDLSLPAAVGLDVSTGLSGTDTNVVQDYADNLTRFVNGFAVTRPTAVANGDVDVLTLPGPLGVVGPASNSAATGANTGAGAAWSFQCPTSTGGTVWQSLPADGNPNDACGSQAANPSAARISFSLDPWGRVNGDTAMPPYTLRYNARWAQFAVNIVGTGVVDCTKAADPNACYTQQYIRYDMTQDGPAWVTDWNQSWTVLGEPIGQIEGAKALVAEEWLDPLSNGFNQPFVSSIARTEFTDRPFGGEYQIVLQLGPEVQLSQIERVQLLVDSTYWVKQQ